MRWIVNSLAIGAWMTLVLYGARAIGAEEALDLDKVAEPKAESKSALTKVKEKISLMGRYDFNFEMSNLEETTRGGDFKNYHQFLFAKVKAHEKVGLLAEFITQKFYEITITPLPRLEIRLGKILVPFGASDQYHKYYGGVQGDPSAGLLLPVVWGEYGISVGSNLFKSDTFKLDGEVYTVKGFGGTVGTQLETTSPASGPQMALGLRLGFTLFGKAKVWGSFYWDQWKGDRDLFLWGGDLLLDYGLAKPPVVKDLRLRAAFARADVNGDNTIGYYYKYGDYIELAWGGLRQYWTPFVRFGTYIDSSVTVTNKDRHTWTIGSHVIPYGPLSITVEYLWNLEEANEIKNDLLRIQVALDF